MHEYFERTGREYKEDYDPAPCTLYYKPKEEEEYKIEKLRNIMTKNQQQPEEFMKMTQKERDQYNKNEQMKGIMDNLISKLKERDTKKNIEQIQRELDEMSASANPLKKCLSMYKINKKMESLNSHHPAEDEPKSHSSPTHKRYAGASNKSNLRDYEQGKTRYKLLTNFVNHYKEKLFLGGGSADAKAKIDDGEQTLTEMQELAVHERNDITFDFEQFMRIFNFEKNQQNNKKILMNTPINRAIDEQEQE